MEDKKANQASVPKKRGHARGVSILLRVLTLLFTVLLVLCGVLLVVNRDQINLDVIKRYLTYHALERSEEGQGVAFPIVQEEESLYAALSDGLLLCNGNRLLLYSDSGAVYVDESVALSNPVVSTQGNYGLVYDAGGSDLYLFSNRQLIFQYEAQSQNGLISAQVNQNGWLALVEQASGYKGSVTVYNASQEPVVTENISSSFVMDAVVSPDNQQLAVLTVGQEGTDFVSTLTIYNISDGASVATQVVSQEPILEFRWGSSGFWLQEPDGVSLYDGQLQLLGQWKDDSLYLRGYSLQGDGFALEYFSRSRAGSVGQIGIFDNQGQQTASMDVGEEVLSVTAAGRYVALLTTSSLTIYTSDFQEYGKLANDGTLRQALMRQDGTAILLTEETASVYLP